MPTTWAWRISDPDHSSKIERLTFAGIPSTLDTISSHLPGGVYTTFRTFGHSKILPLEPQFCRLEESSALMNKSIRLNRNSIRMALREAVQSCQEQEMRIRMTLDLCDHLGMIYISAEKLITPSQVDYEDGVFTITHETERDNPKAKCTSFLVNAEKIRSQTSRNVNEVLLVDHKGYIREGLSSNFFGIMQGSIWTDDIDVLSGIVRAIVLEEARAAGIGILLTALRPTDIGDLEEAFLTSASRSVLPIKKINEQIIGTGKPGPITKKLIGLYLQRVERQLEEL